MVCAMLHDVELELEAHSKDASGPGGLVAIREDSRRVQSPSEIRVVGRS